MLRVLIIDDEILARQRIRTLLFKHQEKVEIIGEASDGIEGKTLIESTKPDLVFLDIQMPRATAFDLIDKIETMPKIIFTTAYEEYALKAFESMAIDYLLKPITQERLDKAINKIGQLTIPNSYDDLKTTIQQNENETKKTNLLSTAVGDRIVLLPTESIVYLSAEQKYVVAKDRYSKEHLLNKSLQNLSENLSEEFMRIHRSVIINLKYVEEVRKTFGSRLVFVMKDKKKSELRSSKSFYSEILKKLNL